MIISQVINQMINKNVLIDKWEILLKGYWRGNTGSKLRKIMLVKVTLWDFFKYQKTA